MRETRESGWSLLKGLQGLDQLSKSRLKGSAGSGGLHQLRSKGPWGIRELARTVAVILASWGKIVALAGIKSSAGLLAG